MGGGTLSIRLTKYNNTQGKSNDGYCCESRYKTSNCEDLCDHYFILCLDQLDGNRIDMKQCRIKKQYTTGSIAKNVITFDDNIGNTPNPRHVKFKKWQRGTLLKIQVFDWDINSDDLVEFLISNITIEPSPFKSKIKWQNFAAVGRTRLDFKIMVRCDQHWYGPACVTFCNSSTYKNGNYECATNGSVVCLHGWTGENCTRETDWAQTSNCSQPGANGCAKHVDGFTCDCKPGYSGQACESCVSHLCHVATSEVMTTTIVEGQPGTSEEWTHNTTANDASQNCTAIANFVGQTGNPIILIILTVVDIMLLVYSGVVTAVLCRKLICANKRTIGTNQADDENAYTYISHSDIYTARTMASNGQVGEQVLATQAEMVSDVHVQMLEETSQHAATNLDEETDGYLAPSRCNIQDKRLLKQPV